MSDFSKNGSMMSINRVQSNRTSLFSTGSEREEKDIDFD